MPHIIIYSTLKFNKFFYFYLNSFFGYKINNAISTFYAKITWISIGLNILGCDFHLFRGNVKKVWMTAFTRKNHKRLRWQVFSDDASRAPKNTHLSNQFIFIIVNEHLKLDRKFTNLWNIIVVIHLSKLANLLQHMLFLWGNHIISS